MPGGPGQPKHSISDTIKDKHTEGSTNGGIPIAGWFIVENPMNMDDLRILVPTYINYLVHSVCILLYANKRERNGNQEMNTQDARGVCFVGSPQSCCTS